MNKKVKIDQIYPVNEMNIEAPLPYTKSEDIQSLEAELAKLYSDLEKSDISIYDLGINSDGSPLRTLIDLRICFNEIITLVSRYETMLGEIHKIEIELLKAFLNKTG